MLIFITVCIILRIKLFQVPLTLKTKVILDIKNGKFQKVFDFVINHYNIEHVVYHFTKEVMKYDRIILI